MLAWYKYCFSHYFTLSGRASRAEYWSFFFVNVLIQVLFAVALAAMGVSLSGYDDYGYYSDAGGLARFVSIAYSLYILIALPPGIAVGVRRLHDRDLPGWLYAAAVLLLPVVIGGLIGLYILYCACLPSLPQPNKYGLRAPKDPTDEVPNIEGTTESQRDANDVGSISNRLGRIVPDSAPPASPSRPIPSPTRPSSRNFAQTPNVQPTTSARTTSGQTRSRNTKSLLDELQEQVARYK